MERVEPFFTEMGLEVEGTDKEILRAIARNLLKSQDSLPDSWESYSISEEKLLQETLHAVEQNLSIDVADSIYGFGTQQFAYGGDEDAPEAAWFTVLSALASAAVDADLRIDRARSERLIEIVQRLTASDLFHRLEEAESLPRSAWEEEVYASYDAGDSPLDWVWTVVRDRLVREMWKEIELLLEQEEMAELIEWATRQAYARGIPAASLKRL